MANLDSMTYIPADPSAVGIQRFTSMAYKALKFGASMTTAGKGAASDSTVGDQGIVAIPQITEPIQYWG